MSSPQSRIKIRCPQCGTDGSARAELLNRRVACKHCAHVFRVIPVEGENHAPPAGMSVSSASAIVPGSPAMDTLRAELAQAFAAARKAEANEAALRKEIEQLHEQLDQTIESSGDESRSSLREEELRFLRDQLDKARAEVEVEARKRREVAATLASKTNEHAEALRSLQQKLDAIQIEHLGKVESEISPLRDELERVRADLATAKITIEALGSERDRLAAEHKKSLESSKTRIAQFENRVVEAEATRTHRDQLARELESLQKRFAETEKLAFEHRDGLEALKNDRERIDAEKASELAGLRDQLSRALAGSADAAILRQELDEIRADRDRIAGELASLQTRFAETERLAFEHRDGLEAFRNDRERIDIEKAAELAELRDQLSKSLASSADAAILRQELAEVRADRDRIAGELETLKAKAADADIRDADLAYPSTEMDIPVMTGASDLEGPTVHEQETVFDDGSGKAKRDAEALKAELAELNAHIEQREAEFTDLAAKAAAETKELRRALYEARLSSENSSKAYLELLDRVRELEAAEPLEFEEPAPPAIDLAILEADRKKAVDEAVKGAWADFERRLAETHEKLAAANARADLMEIEAREAREQMTARERVLDQIGEGSSFGGEVASVTSLRILDARGTARLTLADAEARLALARQLAVERKDKALIDRIGKMTDKVRVDLEARNYTLAETLVRGAEIETGLDPGGFSINGLRIFRASPTIVGSLSALAPSFDRVMRDGELEAIQTTIEEMKTILGDQAGLPEIRRPGRVPTTKRPIEKAAAFRLFIDALVAESWLVRPVVQKRPLPDTSLGTYAALIEAACIARKAAETYDAEQLSFLDEVIQASCLMLTRRQQADGHFPFLDPRGKPSKLATAVDGMIAQRSDAVKDGWVVHVDPMGMAQVETGPCGIALSKAASLLKRQEWFVASQKAAEWAVGQPCLPNFTGNAASIGLIARSYLDTVEDPHLVGLIHKLDFGLLPGQVENGRWVDPQSATTANHLVIFRALLDAWEAIPPDRRDIRKDLRHAINLALEALLEEHKALGAPPQGANLRDLVRLRDLFPDDYDIRIEPAILDSATVIQELCHDGPRPKLGVPADLLATLMLL